MARSLLSTSICVPSFDTATRCFEGGPSVRAELGGGEPPRGGDGVRAHQAAGLAAQPPQGQPRTLPAHITHCHLPCRCSSTSRASDCACGVLLRTTLRVVFFNLNPACCCLNAPVLLSQGREADANKLYSSEILAILMQVRPLPSLDGFSTVPWATLTCFKLLCR